MDQPSQTPAAANALIKATYRISEEILGEMVLAQEHLPDKLRGFELLREGPLDNAAMADANFSSHTTESLARMGRVAGYIREFAHARPEVLGTEAPDLLVATVVHLFRDEHAISQWIEDVFAKQFEGNVGRRLEGQELVTARRASVAGFHDHALAIVAVQQVTQGLISSSIVDFRVGRLLGVAYIVTGGDVERLEPARELALKLERHLVDVMLSS